MKLVFFGSPPAAARSLERLLDHGHEVPLVITQPERPAGRGREPTPPAVKELAQRAGIPVSQPDRIRKDDTVRKKIADIRPDLIVVVAYGQIIPASIFTLPRYCSVNLHFSLLPEYRGAAPVQWAILNGEEKTGVTVFVLSERMDEGDILAQREVKILPGEYAVDLEARLADSGAELLLETVENIASLERRPQDHDQASYAPLIKKEDGRIDWSREASHVDRMVRAFTPWPSAYTFLRGKRVKLLKGKVEVAGKSGRGVMPGRIMAATEEGIAVGCGDGSVYLIRELQMEGKRAISAGEFLRGTPLKPTEAFDSNGA